MNAFVHPIEAMQQFIEFAKKAYGGIVKGLGDLEDKLCGRHGCDAMIHAQAKLVGVIGMIVADFATGGFGIDKLTGFAIGGATKLFGELNDWLKRLNRLAPDVRDRYHRKIQDAFDCPIPLTSVIDKSNTDACDLLRAFKEDFAKLSPEDWDKFFKNPEMVDVWKVINGDFLNPEDFAKYIGRFPDPDVNPDFYNRLINNFFDQDGKLIDDVGLYGLLDFFKDPDIITYISNPPLFFGLIKK